MNYSFIDNSVKNTKYNFLTLIPTVLLVQFSMFANQFYLLMVLTQFIDALKVGFLFSYLAPLVFVMVVTIVKEGYDDYLRHVRDTEANNQLTKRLIVKINKKGFSPRSNSVLIESIKSSEINVGDIIVLEENKRVPADIILLSAKSQQVFIRTDQLDGETDWKLRKPFKLIEQYFLDVEGFMKSTVTKLPLKKSVLVDHHQGEPMNGKVSMSIVSAPPSKQIYEYNGYVELIDPAVDDGKPIREPLFLENTMWANTVMASSSAIGVVINIGKETRSQMNSNKQKNKIGKLDLELNRLSKCLFCIMLICSLVIMLTKEHGINDAYISLVTFFRFMVLLCAIIPISLRVNLDIAKTVNSNRITKDKNIEGSVARNSTLPEELGRVEYMFCDKTGTLTRNEMIFKSIALEQDTYSTENFNELKKILQEEFKKYNSPMQDLLFKPKIKSQESDSTGIDQINIKISNYFSNKKKIRRNRNRIIRDSIAAMALCNSVNVVNPLVEKEKESSGNEQTIADDNKNGVKYTMSNLTYFESCVTPKNNKDIKGKNVGDGKNLVKLDLIEEKLDDENSLGITDRVKYKESKFKYNLNNDNEDSYDNKDNEDINNSRLEDYNKVNKYNSSISNSNNNINNKQEANENYISNDDNKSVIDKVNEAEDENNNNQIKRNLIEFDNKPTKFIDKKDDSDDNLTGNDEKECKKPLNSANYQASSPDEVALVRTACEFGCQLYYRDDKKIIIRNLLKGKNIQTKDRDKELSERERGRGSGDHSFYTTNSDNASVNFNFNSEEVSFYDEEYEILQCFPFSSETKRMGIILRNIKHNYIVFYMKGAENVMKKIIKEESISYMKENCETLGSLGLRTLVFSFKLLEYDEYLSWEQRYKEALNCIENRKQRIASVTAELEKNLEFLCVSGVEDLLQENVYETIDSLRQAGIKLWMLTGDKAETAICIAISTGIKGKTQGISQIVDNSTSGYVQRCLEEMKFSDNFKSNNILIIDGACLETALLYHESLFFHVALKAVSVICCRCSPTQKADIVRIAKKYTDKRLSAIGDGGNDVAMIQEAHVGIGLVGKEGMQASLASDFSILTFKNLKLLLMWHGRLSYKNTATISNFIIHRGLIISFIQVSFILVISIYINT
jgi:magnesium-transporting ATPase (P-type)